MIIGARQEESKALCSSRREQHVQGPWGGNELCMFEAPLLGAGELGE